MLNDFILDTLKKLPVFHLLHTITSKLKDYQVLLVGGCIRDILAKREIKDIDFATNAKPDIIESIFENTLDIGKKFGTITVFLESNSFEITTFRKDFNYDGRHPAGVEFGDLESDVIRRDFTCNALYFDLKNKNLIDHVNGVDSIKSKIIKTVGNPVERFREDKLRMLRAIRFASELDWKIENKTYEAIEKVTFDNISRNRWQSEFDKIILSPNPITGLKKLFETKLIQNYFSKLFKKFNQKINSITTLYGTYETKLATLLYTSDEDDIKCFVVGKKQLLKILEISKILKKDIVSLELWELRQINENPDIINALKSENRINAIDKLRQIKKEYPNLPDPLLDGNDIKDIVKEHKIGKMLKEVRKMQLNETIKTKSQALSRLKFNL